MKVPTVVVRGAIACAVGVAGTCVLWWIVEWRDARDARAARADRAPAAAAPATRPFLRVPATPRRVLLAARLAAVAPDTAPVVEVFADGGAAVRRARPLAQLPGGGEPTDAAIVLPARSLAGLGPDARAVVVDLLGQWIAARPVPGDAVRLIDVRADDPDLAVLLAWVR